jgi:hypothetical protein
MGDEVLTSTGFLATVKEIHLPREGPVHPVPELGSGVEVGVSSRLAPEKGNGPRRRSGRES